MPIWHTIGRLGSCTSVFSLCWFEGHLYGGGDDGKVYRWDGGTVWTAVSNVLDTASDIIYALAVFNGKLYAAPYVNATHRHVYEYNYTLTWTDCGAPRPDDSVHGFGVHAGQLFARCGGGFVYLWDGATTWTSCGHPNLYGSPGGLLVSYSGTLFVAGRWNGSGGARNVATWLGGTSWADAGLPGGETIQAPTDMIEYDGNLYVAKTGSPGHLFRWLGGTGWDDLGHIASASRSTNPVRLSIVNSVLYASTGSADCDVRRYDNAPIWTSLEAGIQGYCIATDGLSLSVGAAWPLAGNVYQYTLPVDSLVHIDNIFVVAKNVILVMFTGSVAVNDNLKNTLNYQITNMSGGHNPTLKRILPTYELTTANMAFYEIDQLVWEQKYEFKIAEDVIQDSEGNNLIETTTIWTMHRTKVDAAISGLSKMYSTAIGSNIRSILEAVMMSDEKIGGDY